jgi:hypothetical protein
MLIANPCDPESILLSNQDRPAYLAGSKRELAVARSGGGVEDIEDCRSQVRG